MQARVQDNRRPRDTLQRVPQTGTFLVSLTVSLSQSLSLSTYLFFSLSSYSSKYLSLLQPGSPFLSYLFSIYFILYKYLTNYQPIYPRWLSPQPKSVRLTNIATLMTLILSRQHRLTCSARKPSRRRSISPADHSYLCLTISPLCIPVW